MKRLSVFLIILLLGYASFAIDYKAAGFELAGELTEDGQLYSVLRDPTGGSLLFRAETEPSANALSQLGALIPVVRSWKGIEIGSIRAVSESDRIRVLILPIAIRRGGENFVSYVLGGIQLFVSKGREYDFRVKSGTFFIRLNGILGSENDLLTDIAAAAKDPAAYLASRDPQYAVRRAAELEIKLNDLSDQTNKLVARADELTTQAKELGIETQDLFGRGVVFANRATASEGKIVELTEKSAEIEGEIAQLEAKDEELSTSLAEAIAGIEKLTTKAADLEMKIEALNATTADHNTRIIALNEQLVSLSGELGKERANRAEREKASEAALMATMNWAFLGGPKFIPEEAVAKLVELKQADPSLDRKAAELKLKELGIKLSAGEIDIVFTVKFGERAKK